MQQPPRATRHGLQAHQLATDAAGIVIRQAIRAPATLRSVADQAIRAASSVVLNLAEGQGRRGRDRMHHWRIAYGSALEAGSAVNLLCEAGCLDRKQAVEALDLLDRVRAMTWRLLHPVR